MKRYEALATDIARSIRQGLLRPGQRLPSVRQASAARKLSPATVFQAYYLLEAQGLVRPRARSGYYVSERVGAMLPEPEHASTPDGESRPVDISALVFEVLESAMARDIVPLGSAFMSPSLFPLAKLGRAMAHEAVHLDPRSTVDDLTPGNAELRRHIALRYRIGGVELGANDLVVSNGAIEALNLCIAATTRPGDAVLVESPCFYVALQTLERHGLHAVEVPTHPREGVELGALDAAIRRHSPKACWLMTSFQNPLGASMPEAKTRELVELLTRHELPLIEDDVYGELHFGARRPLPAKAFDTRGLVLHCSSFSKTLAPGYRIGWTAPGRYAQRVARLKLTNTLATCVPAQLAIARYLQLGGYERHLRALRKTLREQQAAYLQAVAAYFPEGTRVTRPDGGYFLWIELPPDRDALALQRRAAQRGISIAPGPIFSAHRGYRHCLRLNYGHALDERMDAGLRVLGELSAERSAPA